jgi:hypothetical protein
MVSVFFEHNNLDLLSYALGAEDNKTAPQGRVPQTEGKDKQHTHKNCLYVTQYSDDVYLKIAPVFCIYCKWARVCIVIPIICYLSRFTICGLSIENVIRNVFSVMPTNYMSRPIIMPHLKECRCSISPVHGIKKESKSLILSSIAI